ncbi:MAG: bifunctional phosphoribosylaminoimidazolecarboxamide formyltransferase/IMP cyclohydrolase [Acidobacteriota bacterium]|nr:bifunctional phosphoribosylaminoimidazolecarboxamide formyltransferase/IMP cyclohydrolase [Acidobacteriota bacterium]
MRVLISVTDKTGLTEFARGLAALGADLISTGGTARLLRDNGIPVRDVSEVTGFPEMLDGRVKTMHPKITGAILAVRDNPGHLASLREHSIEPIDMVVVNLYQFEKMAARADASLEDLIENIDIGGPTMIRSAAKNWQDVAIVTSPADYQPILDELRGAAKLSHETKWTLAKQAFATTADYDRAISARLAAVGTGKPGAKNPNPEETALPGTLDLRVPRRMSLRYGENPHQRAALYAAGTGGIAGAEQLHGKELSYNNFVDLDACWQLVSEFSNPAAVIVKHTNPAGCAEQSSLADAYRKALECDPVSAFGGVIGLNRAVDEETAAELAKLFVEAIAAPAYSDAALEVLRAKKNIRLVRVAPANDPLVIKSIGGGFLAQTADNETFDRLKCKVVTRREPTPEQWQDLEFAWKVVKHVKSNAIVYARGGQTSAVGAGQMSRVDSVNIGGMKARLPLAGTAVASDAFFPFPDGLEQAAKYGATAFIQPGGSVNDDKVIAAADALGVAMVFTGVRHFRH